MAGVAEQGGVAEAPVADLVHVQQLPDGEAVWVGEFEEAACSGLEGAVDALNG